VQDKNCNVCEGKLTPILPAVRDPFTNVLFRIERCERCSLGHTLPKPDDLNPYYATEYYGNRHGFTAGHCSRRRIGFVKSAINGAKPLSLLDIGCGDGSFLLAATEQGWRVMGTELNPQLARNAGLDVKENIELIGTEERFDCITMWHTLEHMRDIPSMLGSVFQRLDPEGRLIVAVPDWGGMQAAIFREHWLHLDVPRHLFHFNLKSLKSALESTGFTIERHWHMEFEYDLLGWSQSALNRITPWQNLFFDTITGKRTNAGLGKRWISLLGGFFLTVAAVPAVLMESLLGRGGTLIVVAKKNSI
jgi:SAM-dependent methyltransferase